MARAFPPEGSGQPFQTAGVDTVELLEARVGQFAVAESYVSAISALSLWLLLVQGDDQLAAA
jgi:hypothetical protein